MKSGMCQKAIGADIDTTFYLFKYTIVLMYMYV